MANTQHDLTIIDDGLSWVRAHPDMFFPHGVSAADLAAGLVDEALILGATDIGVVRELGWHAVGADLDWFTAGQYQAGDDELFRRVLAFPERGQNSLRVEILVAAFADDVVTITPTRTVLVAGKCEAVAALQALLVSRRWTRLVGFRMQTAPN
jgi:hypothetical protein